MTLHPYGLREGERRKQDPFAVFEEAPSENETSGPGTAARFCDLLPLNPSSQEVTQCRNPV